MAPRPLEALFSRITNDYQLQVGDWSVPSGSSPLRRSHTAPRRRFGGGSLDGSCCFEPVSSAGCPGVHITLRHGSATLARRSICRAASACDRHPHRQATRLGCHPGRYAGSWPRVLRCAATVASATRARGERAGRWYISRRYVSLHAVAVNTHARPPALTGPALHARAGSPAAAHGAAVAGRPLPARRRVRSMCKLPPFWSRAPPGALGLNLSSAVRSY